MTFLHADGFQVVGIGGRTTNESGRSRARPITRAAIAPIEVYGAEGVDPRSAREITDSGESEVW
jgi:hypothetical protein